MLLPARGTGRKVIVIEKPNKWGYSLKQVIREKAKRNPLYHTPIEITPPVTGDEGVAINTLGRWLFGVPGYRGQITVRGGREDAIEIEVPSEIPAEGIKLLMEAANNL